MKLKTLKDVTDEDLLNILVNFKRYVLKGDFENDNDIKNYIKFINYNNHD